MLHFFDFRHDIWKYFRNSSQTALVAHQFNWCNWFRWLTWCATSNLSWIQSQHIYIYILQNFSPIFLVLCKYSGWYVSTMELTLDLNVLSVPRASPNQTFFMSNQNPRDKIQQQVSDSFQVGSSDKFFWVVHLSRTTQ